MAAVLSEESKSELGKESESHPKTNLCELNEEQKKFLIECEEEFSNRYTDDDAGYVKSKTMRDSDRKEPPIVEFWYSKPPRRRDHDWDRRNRDRDDRHHRHAGRHHMYQRNSRPY